MKNELIKRELKKHNLKQWQLADMLGIREESLCKKMRYELSKEEQERIISLIEKEGEKHAR